MKHAPILALFLLTAACGSAANDGELEPGNWKQTATITAVTLPGAPAAVAQRASQAMIGKPQSHESCLSAAEAKLGVKAMAQAMQDGQCTASDFVASGGKLTGKVACKMTGTDTADFAITGTYTRTSLAMNADMTTRSASIPGGTAQMKLTMTAQHAGACNNR